MTGAVAAVVLVGFPTTFRRQNAGKWPETDLGTETLEEQQITEGKHLPNPPKTAKQGSNAKPAMEQ